MRSALVALVLLLAGCIDAQGPAQAPTATVEPALQERQLLPEGPALDRNATVEAPVWNVGDAFLVTATYGDEQAAYTLVVSASDGSTHTLSSTDPQTATYDALFDISYVGRIRARDLAGSQQDAPVQFFSFPLADGKTWKAEWDGLSVDMVATFNPSIPTPLGNLPGFDIVATAGGAPHATYDYVPALGWWSRLEFAEGYGLRVDERVANWTGALASATVKTLLDQKGPVPLVGPNAHAFVVSPEQHTVSVLLTGTGPAIVRAMGYLDPQGHPVNSQAETVQFKSDANSFWMHEELAPTPGEWKVLSPVLHGPDASYRLQVREVGVTQKPFP